MDCETCDADLEIPEDVPLLTVRLSKFVEGILVGGHVLVIIFSMCGNIGALIVVLSSKAPRVSTKYFLTLLALSDVLMTVTAPTTEILKLITEYYAWVLGEALCNIIPFLQTVAATMSAMCLMVIAVERNLLVFGTMRANAMGRQMACQQLAGIISGILTILVPIACGIPSYWLYEHLSFTVKRNEEPLDNTTMSSSSTTTTRTTTTPKSSCPSVHYFCTRTNFDSRNIVHWSVTGATLTLLLACVCLCYVSIYHFVKKYGVLGKNYSEEQSRTSNGSSNRTGQSQVALHDPEAMVPAVITADRHKKTLRLILSLIFLHIFCRLPNTIYLLLVNVIVIPITETSLTLLEFCHLLSGINSALNPFLYVIWNHSLRSNGVSQSENSLPSSCCSCSSTGSSAMQRLRHALRYICSCCKYQHRTIQHQSDLCPVQLSPATEEDAAPAMVRSHQQGKAPQIYHIVTSRARDQSNQSNTLTT